MNRIPFIKRLLDQLNKKTTGKATAPTPTVQASAWAASGRTELMQNRHAVRMKTFNTKPNR